MITARVILFLTNLVIGLAEFLIGLRVILKLLGAGISAPFVQWVYQTSDSLLTPFLGMFPTSTLPEGFTIEFSALFGLIVYAFIGYLISEAIGFFETRRTVIIERTERKKG